MNKKNIVIVGAGAVGASLAAQLVVSEENKVYFAANGDREKRLREESLVVNGKTLDIPVVPFNKPDLGFDLLILSVKSPQLNQVLQEIGLLLSERTTVLSLLNGIQSEEQIAAVYGWERTLYGYVVGIDAVRSDNSIRSLSNGRFVFGRKNNKEISKRVAEVRDIFEAAGVDYEIPADMIRKLWWKFMVNVGINPSSAILRAPYKVFQNCNDARSLMNNSIDEVLSVSTAEGIGLDRNDVDVWHSILDGLDPTGKTSMLQDVEAKRQTEVDIFCGTISALGRKHSISTPLNDAMSQMIKVIEFNY